MHEWKFYKIVHQASRTGRCKCGKRRVKRSKTFWQTLNPFNVNAKGEPKSLEEIREELKSDAERWLKSRITCRECC